MPIQPMSINGYTQIPDDEDVTPVDKDIRKMEKKNTKSVRIILLIVVFVLIFAAAIFTGVQYVVSAIRKEVTIYQTSMDQLNLGMIKISADTMKETLNGVIDGLTFDNIQCNSDADKCSFSAKLYVNRDIHYQKIIGFGGAFTESSAHNFYKLPVHIQNEVLEKYFGSDGIGLTLGRIHINSCDFSLSSYNFDDIDNDYSLLYFDTEVTHDNVEIIPFILSALEVSSRPIKLVASPWSPPAWMKESIDGKRSMNGSATPNGLRNEPAVKLAWAHYISKFITAYDRKGIPIWAVTPQNEPEFPAPWEACAYDTSRESEFISDYLGPVIKAEHPNILILGYDHNKDHLLTWTDALVNGDEKGYLDGMAFHWYGGLDRVTDGTFGYNTLNASYHLAKDKIFLNTEGCSCPNVAINDWLRAERLGHDIIYDLQNYAQGWIDWNLLVDYLGGPNQKKNYCDASILTLKDFSNIFIQPKYHYFGHFSKFITPDSLRVFSKLVGDYQFQEINPNIQSNIELAFHNCEKSSRQMWKLQSETKYLQLVTSITLNKKDNDGIALGAEYLCLGYGNTTYANSRKYLRTQPCNVTWEDKSLLLEVNYLPTGQIQDTKSDLCLSLADGVQEPGALIELVPCDDLQSQTDTSLIAHPQRFTYNLENGEVSSSIFDPLLPESFVGKNPGIDRMCLTAGWPFLSAIAAETSEDQGVVVIMNEASVSTTVELIDNTQGQDQHIGFAIPAHSMQTLVY